MINNYIILPVYSNMIIEHWDLKYMYNKLRDI